ncbi:MAG: N-acetyl-D-Glu racemase DgcA [Salaquimonas sp.]
MNTLSHSGLELEIDTENWPIAGSFVISRGARTIASVIKVTLRTANHAGVGECVPYARYSETLESVTAQIETLRSVLQTGISRTELLTKMPAGAARNAIDCALWDLEAKQSGISAWKSAGLCAFVEATTAFTISLGTPEKMATDCQKASERSILKIKLGGEGDIERMRAVGNAAKNQKLVLDANEAWSTENFETYMAVAKEIGADLIEQPLPAGKDDILEQVERIVPVCADESLHTREELKSLRRRYDCINIKLDKTGGLTEALELKKAAIEQKFQVMVGCMVSTSLSMAPAMILAQGAQFVDLDGPLLLAKDRIPGMRYAGSTIYPPSPVLWG